MPNYTLPEGWRWSTLSEFADVINGVNYDGNEECKTGIRILRGGNIQSKNILIKDDDVFLPRKYKCDENTVRIGDTIMVASTGSVEVLGKAAGCLEDLGETQIGAFLRLIRPKNVAHAPFITALLTSDYFSRYIKASAANGTGINNIRNGYLLDFPIPVPEDGELNRISGVLSSIDSKIALNRRINQKLEETARRLYDYWFLQFDFPAPAGSLTTDGQPIPEGAPYRSSGGAMSHNASLNREIPIGWDVKELKNILTVLKDGTHNPPKRFENGVALLTGTMFGENFLEYNKATYVTMEDYNTIHSRYQPKAGDIILTKIGTIGNVNLLRESDIPIVIHCNSALMRFDEAYAGAYAFLMCKSQLFFNRLYAKRGQSIQEFVSLEKIGSVLVEDVPNSIVSAFNAQAQTYIDALKNLQDEIDRLVALRDRLLPLLMNGQVSVND